MPHFARKGNCAKCEKTTGERKTNKENNNKYLEYPGEYLDDTIKKERKVQKNCAKEKKQEESKI